MSKFLLFILATSSILSVYASPASQRIVNGGKATSVSEYAVEVTSVFLDHQLQTWGGGTLIAPRVVLTSAQIVLGYTTFIVRFGSVQWGNLYSVEVVESAIHPRYEQRTQLNDIAFLRLAKTVDRGGLMKLKFVYRVFQKWFTSLFSRSWSYETSEDQLPHSVWKWPRIIRKFPTRRRGRLEVIGKYKI